MIKIIPGDRFYLKVGGHDGKLDLRIIRIKNENTFIAKRNNGDTIKITRKQLEESYNRISPHGVLFTSIVDMKENQDVVISLYRMKDVKNQKDSTAWAVCRQLITDIFSETINNNPYLKYCGVSVSKKSLIQGYDFKQILACDGISFSKEYSVYMDDNIDTILSLIDKKSLERMNTLLANLKKKFNDDYHTGYCGSLKELLEEKDFMFDFLSAWNIERVKFEISELYGQELLPVHRGEIEKLVGCQMLKTYVIPFSYEIDLAEIQRNCVFVTDTNKRLFIIAYDKGDYLPDAIKEKLINNRDVLDTLRHVKNQGQSIEK